ncbi:SseB family protein [Streptomyces sp. NPDC006259]|uniref:SseB family protein n=1 Tax=unclassified Streptomyces TaxID=2593676 RepID=UPI0033A763BB
MRDDSIPEELLVTAAQEALRDLNRTPDDRAVLDTLVACDILVPEPDEFIARRSPEEGRLTLPVIDDPPQPHTVPVFTSVERMLEALPDVRIGHQIPLGLLAANWPTDEDLALAIDLGHPDGLIFAGQDVHTLLVPPWR